MSFDIDRIKLKHCTYMNMALSISQLGTCCRAKVGVIMLREDGSIASAGYNGAPPGMKHCSEETCNAENRCVHTAHAEENAIFFSRGEMHTAYITHEPCLNCTRMMARRGIRVMYYKKHYSSMPERERIERDAIIDHHGICLMCIDDVL